MGVERREGGRLVVVAEEAREEERERKGAWTFGRLLVVVGVERGGSMEDRELFFCFRMGGGVMMEEVGVVVGSVEELVRALLYMWWRLISFVA